MKRWFLFQYAIRSLIPAWRFFDEAEGAVSLHLKPVGSPDSEWIMIDPSLEIRWFHLFYNPDGLSIHAFHNFLKLVHRDPSHQELQATFRGMVTRLGKRSFPEHAEFNSKIVEADS
jgi:hypothetical protein